MQKFVIFILVVLLLTIALGKDQIEQFYQKFFNSLPKIEQLIQDKVEEVRKEVNTPPPLRSKQDSPQAFLTVSGVIKFTNIQRQNYNLPPLSENSLLNQSAQKKVEDMFNKQYFEHISPDGRDVSDLAEDVGYEFIVIGENLALGNFLNDQVLVQAWMDSEGHRENILNSKYTEIGVAVLKGTYQGKTTWLAVQHFGKPLSDCPKPDQSLEQKLEEDKNRLEEMAKDLEARKQELERMRRRDPEYNQKVEEYNKLVEEYNSLLSETKGLTEDYNQQVRNFNICAS